MAFSAQVPANAALQSRYAAVGRISLFRWLDAAPAYYHLANRYDVSKLTSVPGGGT
jgi:hypothetical protein